ncbi:DUF4349 domain-containing protein [Aquibacillus kalidii]|uniref:DUF4349 domain-containing protein n=1 Tax=Aquibacillus kalidii TaxID=2762597 RepID=UPI0016453BF4|nr:DUF4349 domain-containing protein [Aquibacillus kalidii]
MKKWITTILFLIISSVLFTACQSNDESAEYESTAEDTMNTEAVEEKSEEFKLKEESATTDQTGSQDQETKATDSIENPTKINRKIIYTANLRLQVKQYNKAVDEINTQIQEKGGYIVESHTYGGADDQLKEGMITARIPQEQFQTFLQFIENGDMKVLENSVSGEDVTEEYVDLESRLKSKKVVEERLLSFMEKAEKTEDLLKISEDLATVQEEIEQITGRLNYLQNKSDLATVTIHLQENKVNIPSVNNKELNTWEKTKQQFMKSTNFLLSSFSGLFVFIVGSFPLLLILGIVCFIIYRISRKNRQEKQNRN